VQHGGGIKATPTWDIAEETAPSEASNGLWKNKKYTNWV
jgi:hypothetical protein